MTTTVSGSQITFNDNTTQNTSAYGGGFAFLSQAMAILKFNQQDNSDRTLDKYKTKCL